MPNRVKGRAIKFHPPIEEGSPAVSPQLAQTWVYLCPLENENKTNSRDTFWFVRLLLTDSGADEKFINPDDTKETYFQVRLINRPRTRTYPT